MYKKSTITGHFGNSSQSVLFACSSNTLPKHPYFRVLNCPIKPPEILKGDITKLNVDAIVNAANKTLLGGGGVDGAIHRAAGYELLEECRSLNGCETGQAKITKGYKLPAKFIIHTVGPVWYGGNKNEREMLKSCYKTTLELTKKFDIKMIAFPAISCGIYRFPLDEASKIAIDTIKEYLQHNNNLDKVILIDINDEIVEKYKNLII